nr:hypothetical protein [Tanacetum cinerariifolium]
APTGTRRYKDGELSNRRRVVGRQLNADLVAGKNADVVLAHLAGDVRGYDVPIFQLHTEHGVGQGVDDSAFHFEAVFFRHAVKPSVSNEWPGANGSQAKAGCIFDRPILGLVIHLFAVLYPVAQVNSVQLHARRFGNLPEDGVAAKAATLLGRLVERVPDQKRGKLITAGWKHVAIGVALLDVALVEIEILFAEMRFDAGHFQVDVALENTFLLAIRHEQPDRNSRRHAGTAILAVRTVQMIATAAKPHVREIGIDLNIHRLAGVEKQRCGLFLGQAASRHNCLRPDVRPAIGRRSDVEWTAHRGFAGVEWASGNRS